ncbi:MAG: ImmA/IrrE family metallo-endopeptidase [Deltaproteobacteria bacterium]|nr:ImmA/IrrE family metallo-endopeptidase [Deltaproteobacteria bacterium]
MRRSAGYRLDAAICVYDLAERLGIEIRFLDIPSMEGMYYRASEPAIILSSLRPPGRRVFTCAHELGHHNQRNGTHVDHFAEQWKRPGWDSKEFAADCFAGALLMPKMAVERAFTLRQWKISESTPGQVYRISTYFGVGYTTLIHHMRTALLLLPQSHAEALLKVNRRQAQALALGWETPETVWVVDAHWTDRAIDVEAGDLIFVHGQPSSEGNCIERVVEAEGGRLLRASQPGIGRLEDGSGWSAFVRVSRRGFVGRSLYRHLEEPDDE